MKIKTILKTFVFFILLSSVISEHNGFISDAQTIEELEKSIKNLQETIDRTLRELEESEKKLQQMDRSRRNVLEEIRQNERRIESLNKMLVTLRNEENKLKREMENTEKRISEAAENLENKAEQYSQHIRSMYMRRRTSHLEIIFSGIPLSTRIRALKMMNVVTADDVSVLKELEKAKAQWEELLKRRQMELEATLSLSNTRRREQQNLARTKSQRENLLAEIRKNEALESARQKDYREEIARSRAQMSKLIEELDKMIVSLPVDLENYNFASRKGKLQWPVKGNVITLFGLLTDPITKTQVRNPGIEIETTPDHPVRAIGSGKVMIVGYNRGYGNHVVIYCPPNYYTIYGHLNDIRVVQDDVVREGEVIGTAGTSGIVDATTPRLLLEVRNRAVAVDPLEWLAPNR